MNAEGHASEEPVMEYGEHPCSAELSPWIAAHWHFRVEPGTGRLEHRVPLTGGAILALPSGAPPILAGPRTTPLVTEVRGGDVIWGTHFWPWATASFLGNVDRLREVQLPLRMLGLEAIADRLQDSGPAESDGEDVPPILDRAWTDHAANCKRPDDVVVRGAAAILASGGTRPVGEIASGVGLSPRQFRRRFRAAVGLTPKEVARIQRVRATAVGVVRQADREWVDHALARGFADQAHLIRELRAFFGTRPTEVERHLRRIRHGHLVR